VPAVIFDIQRVGPSTGLPTRTAQGDILSTAMLSHGDTKQILLIPASVEECYTMAIEAFDLAERLQTLVFIMSDLDLGMNTWMSDPFPYPETPPVRGKLLTPAKLEELGSWGRYRDVDGDGIPYRTVPGDGMPAYFTRGTGHNEQAVYSERPDDWVRNLDRIAKKFETARTLVPQPEVEARAGAKVGLVAFGTTHWGAVESRDQLAAEAGLDVSYCRLRAYPFTSHLEGFLRSHERVYVVEQNRDAQMMALIKAELDPALLTRLRSVLHYSGLPIDGRSITDDILRQEGLGNGPAAGPSSSGGSMVGGE
jgi:2-oxoglutarate ferredoxin oxidoreductase subunit alpha